MRIAAALIGAVATAGFAVAAEAATWRYQEIKDPITDAARGIAALDGEGGTLVIKCDKNGPESIYLSIIAKKFLGGVRGDRDRAVLMRLDDGEVQRISWWHDGQSAIFTDTGKAGPLAKKLAVAKKVVFRLTDYDGDNVDVLLTSDGDVSNPQKAFSVCGQAWDSEAVAPTSSALPF